MMKNLLLGIAAVAMVTNAMAVVPVQKGELKADEAVKQVMLKRADGRMQAVAPSQMSLRTPQKLLRLLHRWFTVVILRMSKNGQS